MKIKFTETEGINTLGNLIRLERSIKNLIKNLSNLYPDVTYLQRIDSKYLNGLKRQDLAMLFKFSIFARHSSSFDSKTKKYSDRTNWYQETNVANLTNYIHTIRWSEVSKDYIPKTPLNIMKNSEAHKNITAKTKPNETISIDPEIEYIILDNIEFKEIMTTSANLLYKYRNLLAHPKISDLEGEEISNINLKKIPNRYSKINSVELIDEFAVWLKEKIDSITWHKK